MMWRWWSAAAVLCLLAGVMTRAGDTSYYGVVKAEELYQTPGNRQREQFPICFAVSLYQQRAEWNVSFNYYSRLHLAAFNVAYGLSYHRQAGFAEYERLRGGYGYCCAGQDNRLFSGSNQRHVTRG